jgi:hypothetical protein
LVTCCGAGERATPGEEAATSQTTAAVPTVSDAGLSLDAI